MCYMYMHIVSDMEIYALVLLNIDLFARKNEMKLKKNWKIVLELGAKEKALHTCGYYLEI